jgi:hypothetical protein
MFRFVALWNMGERVSQAAFDADTNSVVAFLDAAWDGVLARFEA